LKKCLFNMIKSYNKFVNINESNGSIIGLSELNSVIKKIFNDTKVSSVGTTYEKFDDGYKIIITINNIFYNKTNIIHTKLVFYTDKNKSKLINNYFDYLYDINCVFKRIKFDDIYNLESKINNIFDNKKFGEDIKTLSDINVVLSTTVNKWLKDNDIDTISLYNITYNPLVDSLPCDSMFFEFDINLDDIRHLKMNIKKLDKNEFKISFSENEWFKDITIDSLKAIPQTIGEIVKNHIL